MKSELFCKKFLTIFFLLLLTTVIAGCGGSGSDISSNGDDSYNTDDLVQYSGIQSQAVIDDSNAKELVTYAMGIGFLDDFFSPQSAAKTAMHSVLDSTIEPAQTPLTVLSAVSSAMGYVPTENLSILEGFPNIDGTVSLSQDINVMEVLGGKLTLPFVFDACEHCLTPGYTDGECAQSLSIDGTLEVELDLDDIYAFFGVNSLSELATAVAGFDPATIEIADLRVFQTIGISFSGDITYHNSLSDIDLTFSGDFSADIQLDDLNFENDTLSHGIQGPSIAFSFDSVSGSFNENSFSVDGKALVNIQADGMTIVENDIALGENGADVSCMFDLFTFTWNQDQMALDGDLLLTVNEIGELLDILLSTEEISVSATINGKSRNLTLKGDMGTEIEQNFFPLTISMDILLQDNSTATAPVYWFNDYEILISTDSLLRIAVSQGRFYHPEYGSASVATDTPFTFANSANYPTDGTLIATGDQSKVRLAANDNGTYNIELYDQATGAFKPGTSSPWPWLDM